MTGRVKVTITAWYMPEPESYEYGDQDDLTLAEMAAQDEALWRDEQVGVNDILDWCDEYEVAFDAVEGPITPRLFEPSELDWRWVE